MNETQRNSARSVMNFLLLRKSKVHYPPIVNGVIERQQTLHEITKLTELAAIVNGPHGLIADCSQTSQVILQVALGKQIATWDVTTDWFLSNCPIYHDPSAAYIAAALVWGDKPGHHMALVWQRGNTLQRLQVCSHGGDPIAIHTAEQESFYQNFRPLSFCSVAHL